MRLLLKSIVLLHAHVSHPSFLAAMLHLLRVVAALLSYNISALQVLKELLL